MKQRKLITCVTVVLFICTQQLYCIPGYTLSLSIKNRALSSRKISPRKPVLKKSGAASGSNSKKRNIPGLNRKPSLTRKSRDLSSYLSSKKGSDNNKDKPVIGSRQRADNFKKPEPKAAYRKRPSALNRVSELGRGILSNSDKQDRNNLYTYKGPAKKRGDDLTPDAKQGKEKIFETPEFKSFSDDRPLKSEALAGILAENGSDPQPAAETSPQTPESGLDIPGLDEALAGGGTIISNQETKQSGEENIEKNGTLGTDNEQNHEDAIEIIENSEVINLSFDENNEISDTTSEENLIGQENTYQPGDAVTIGDTEYKATEGFTTEGGIVPEGTILEDNEGNTMISIGYNDVERLYQAGDTYTLDDGTVVTAEEEFLTENGEIPVGQVMAHPNGYHVVHKGGKEFEFRFEQGDTYILADGTELAVEKPFSTVDGIIPVGEELIHPDGYSLISNGKGSFERRYHQGDAYILDDGTALTVNEDFTTVNNIVPAGTEFTYGEGTVVTSRGNGEFETNLHSGNPLESYQKGQEIELGGDIYICEESFDLYGQDLPAGVVITDKATGIHWVSTGNGGMEVKVFAGETIPGYTVVAEEDFTTVNGEIPIAVAVTNSETGQRMLSTTGEEFAPTFAAGDTITLGDSEYTVTEDFTAVIKGTGNNAEMIIPTGQILVDENNENAGIMISDGDETIETFYPAGSLMEGEGGAQLEVLSSFTTREGNIPEGARLMDEEGNKFLVTSQGDVRFFEKGDALQLESGDNLYATQYFETENKDIPEGVLFQDEEGNFHVSVKVSNSGSLLNPQTSTSFQQITYQAGDELNGSGFSFTEDTRFVQNEKGEWVMPEGTVLENPEGQKVYINAEGTENLFFAAGDTVEYNGHTLTFSQDVIAETNADFEGAELTDENGNKWTIISDGQNTGYLQISYQAGDTLSMGERELVCKENMELIQDEKGEWVIPEGTLFEGETEGIDRIYINGNLEAQYYAGQEFDAGGTMLTPLEDCRTENGYLPEGYQFEGPDGAIYVSDGNNKFIVNQQQQPLQPEEEEELENGWTAVDRKNWAIEEKDRRTKDCEYFNMGAEDRYDVEYEEVEGVDIPVKISDKESGEVLYEEPVNPPWEQSEEGTQQTGQTQTEQEPTTPPQQEPTTPPQQEPTTPPQQEPTTTPEQEPTTTPEQENQADDDNDGYNDEHTASNAVHGSSDDDNEGNDGTGAGEGSANNTDSGRNTGGDGTSGGAGNETAEDEDTVEPETYPDDVHNPSDTGYDPDDPDVLDGIIW